MHTVIGFLLFVFLNFLSLYGADQQQKDDKLVPYRIDPKHKGSLAKKDQKASKDKKAKRVSFQERVKALENAAPITKKQGETVAEKLERREKESARKEDATIITRYEDATGPAKVLRNFIVMLIDDLENAVGRDIQQLMGQALKEGKAAAQALEENKTDEAEVHTKMAKELDGQAKKQLARYVWKENFWTSVLEKEFLVPGLVEKARLLLEEFNTTMKAIDREADPDVKAWMDVEAEKDLSNGINKILTKYEKSSYRRLRNKTDNKQMKDEQAKEEKDKKKK